MSRMLTRSTVFATTLLIIATTAGADTTYHRSSAPSDDTQMCRVLTIEVQNHTRDICYLVVNHLYNGVIIGDIQQVLFQGYTKTIQLEQSYYGPNITLVYQCGKKRITLANQQGACFGWAGDAYATVVSADAGIKATSQIQAASKWANTAGQITWDIQNTR